MKKLLVVVLVVAVCLIGATAAMATIANSKHDLSTSSTNSIHATDGELSSCAFCHTPHHSVSSVAPLWNRTLGAGGYAATGGGYYTVYGATATNTAGGTLSGTQVNAPGPNSKTCLSCHDGTLSLADVSFGTNRPTAFDDPASKLDVDNSLGAGSIGNSGLGGTDLTKEHPVGVVYNVLLSGGPGDPGLNPTLTVPASGSAAFRTVGTTAFKVYFNGASYTVECGSCHDPHNTTVGMTPFLKGNKATICSDCHSNK